MEMKTCFFLGAGASVPAGVPDTREFVYGKDDDGGFIHHIEKHESKEKEETLKRVLGVLEKQSPVDVEILLGTLERLENWEEDTLSGFFVSAGQKFRRETLTSLVKKLRQFIRDNTVVSGEQVEYLVPLVDMVPLEIFTVNYDTCIEQLCYKHSLTYTDGFEFYWNSEHFEHYWDIKLYKIHGSVTWYRTDRNTFVKIPIESRDEDGINLLFGGKATNVMIYPVPNKSIDARPLWELLLKLSDTLCTAELCICVGYRFRDDEIRRIFFEASERNPNLKLCLVSPDAGRVFTETLEFVDTAKMTLSRLSERVICMNHPFEKVLEYGALNKLGRSILELQGKYKEAQKKRIGGLNFRNDLVDCSKMSTEIGYVSFAEKILFDELQFSLGQEEGNKYFWRDNRSEEIEIIFWLALHHLFNGSYSSAKGYFEFLRKRFEKSLSQGERFVSIARKIESRGGKPIAHLSDRIELIKKEMMYLPPHEFYSENKWHYYPFHMNRILAELMQLGISRKEEEDLLQEIKTNCERLAEALGKPSRGGMITREGFEIPLEKFEECRGILRDLIQSLISLEGYCMTILLERSL
jgi:hypothetical protein